MDTCSVEKCPNLDPHTDLPVLGLSFSPAISTMFLFPRNSAAILSAFSLSLLENHLARNPLRKKAGNNHATSRISNKAGMPDAGVETAHSSDDLSASIMIGIETKMIPR